MYDCPVCHIAHDEPAEARVGMHVVCIDCHFEEVMKSATVLDELLPAA